MDQMCNEYIPAVQLEQSYERDSRWKPHLSWSFLSWTLQQRMEEQAAKREQAWQRITDKLGPMLISDEACTFGRGDLNSFTIDERAYERVPFISHNHQNQKHSGTKIRHNINQCQTLFRNGHKSNRFTLNGSESDGPASPPVSLGSDSPNDSPDTETYVVKQSSISDYGGLSSSKNSFLGAKSSKYWGGSLNAAPANAGIKTEEVCNSSYSMIKSFRLEQKISSYSLLGDRHSHDVLTTKQNRMIDKDAKNYEDYKRAQKRCVAVSGILVLLIVLLFTLVTLMAFGILHR